MVVGSFAGARSSTKIPLYTYAGIAAASTVGHAVIHRLSDVISAKVIPSFNALSTAKKIDWNCR